MRERLAEYVMSFGFLLQHSKAEYIPSKLKSIKKKINSNPRLNNMIVPKGLARPAASVAVCLK